MISRNPSPTTPTCKISLSSLKLPAPEAGDFLEITLYIEREREGERERKRY
jgi:hypothetical protein